MKAISLWQPWATLVALGEKQFETRSWSTSYRGPIAIHAAKKWNRELAGVCGSYFFSNALVGNDYNDPNDLPRGCFVAIAELVEIIPTDEAWHLASYKERAFGNYQSGRFAWKLEDIRAIEPLPARGMQGLWGLDEPTVLALQSRLSPRLVLAR